MTMHMQLQFAFLCLCISLFSVFDIALSCPKDRFRCYHRGCILESFICDDRSDCSDGSDENPKLCKAPLEVSLANGRDSSSGRVEIKFLGQWGTICGAKFSDNDGKVICRSLGFNGPFSIHRGAFFGVSEGKIWLNQLNCSGTEKNIIECKRSPWGVPNCNHRDEVGLTCSRVKPAALTEAPTILCGMASSDAIGKNYKYHLPQRSYVDVNSHSRTPQKLFPPSRNETLGAMIRKRRMVHSEDVQSLSVFPWIAEIRFLASGVSSHYCGAVILSEYFVLTAAHCVETLRVVDYLVRVGEFDQSKRDPYEEDFEVAIIAIHKDYNVGTYLNNDIAVVKILPKAGRGIRFSQQVLPVCLPSVSAPYHEKTEGVIGGWGITEKGEKSMKLRVAKVPLISQGMCKYYTNYGDKLVTPSMFCAGHLSGGSDACEADSGGPLIVKVNGRFTIFGIISWGFSCGAQKRPGVYSNTQYHLRWIVSQINRLSD